MSLSINDKVLDGIQAALWILAVITTLVAFEDSSYAAAGYLCWGTLWLCVTEEKKRRKVRVQQIMDLWVSNLQKENKS